MNIRQLQYFIAVAREGTFSAAAKKLGISQPPLSSQIKLLEEELGVTLLERGGRGVRLTQAGERLYLRACTLTELVSSTLEEVKEQRADGELLRLGTISSCAPALLESRMPRFLAEHPHVRFALTEGNTFELIGKLKDGIIDLAVVRTPFRKEDFDCAYLEEEPMAALGLPCFFPDTAKDSVTLEELSGAPLIFYRRFEHLLLSVFQESAIEPNAFCVNDDARTTLLWANAGLGVALAPLSICRLLQSEKTVLYPVKEAGLVTRIAAIKLKNRALSPAAQDLFALFGK